MNKIVAVISLTAFFCSGVQSSDLSERELKGRIVNSGIAVLSDFLNKVENVVEKIISDDQFRKSRIVVQGHLKDLMQVAKQLNDIDRAKNDTPRANGVMLTLSAAAACEAIIREITGKLFHPFMNIYHGTSATETIAGIWREVESDYLHGAPPVYKNPMSFLSYLLAKAVVKSGLVNAFKGGVDIALEIGKIDLNQLHEELQLFMNHVGEKAAEISAIERQKEKNDFLVSLRTASGVIVFYWDQLLEHTESSSFHQTYLDSVTRWVELTKLQNASEPYHILLDPKTKENFLNWTDKLFHESIHAVTLEYYKHGNEIFGEDRFNHSNWAALKIVTVYGLSVFEKLTESGFGIGELNRFLHRADHTLLALEGTDWPDRTRTFTEELIRQTVLVITLFAEAEKEKAEDDEIMVKLPLKVIKRLIVQVWDIWLHVLNHRHIPVHNPLYQKSERDWNHVKSIFINELLKSGEFTKEQLDEAETNLINGTVRTLQEVMKVADMADEFEERKEASHLGIKHLMYFLNTNFHDVWDTLVE